MKVLLKFCRVGFVQNLSQQMSAASREILLKSGMGISALFTSVAAMLSPNFWCN